MPRSQSPSDRAPSTPAGATSTATHDDAASLPDDVAALSYEDARDELVRVVARLEAGGETLEGSLALWERGEALATRCQQWLDGARARLDAARGTAPGPGDGSPASTADDEQDAPDDEEPR
ncbi:exodeoxyribonuclease VII small subunit [Cellulomonas sp. APG4]|uniref:exodeoxyribonuclease VII small subunit n=1 Tax=Cellulomonas sp. APG4 TaxID=1538656 RepID=UPI00351AE6DC